MDGQCKSYEYSRKKVRRSLRQLSAEISSDSWARGGEKMEALQTLKAHSSFAYAVPRQVRSASLRGRCLAFQCACTLDENRGLFQQSPETS